MSEPDPLSEPLYVEPPRSYEEMAARPGFVDKVDPKVDSIRACLARYWFDQKAHCGKSDCRTPHNDGFLVVTTAGRETNVGNVCGKAFGESFRLARHNLREREARRVQLNAARPLQDAAPKIAARVQEMTSRHFGIAWVTRQLRPAVRAVVGNDNFAALVAFEKRGDRAVYEDVRLSKAEVERRHALNSRVSRESLRYERRLAGVAEPMPWLTFDYNERLMQGLVLKLQMFAQLDAAQLSPRKLAESLKAFDGHERTLLDAEASLDAAVRFIAPRNVELIAKLFVHSKQAAAIERWPQTAGFKALKAGEP